MSARISELWMSQLSGFVAGQMGLYFPRKRWRELEQGMLNAAGELGFRDAEACIQWLASSPLEKHQIEILASHLTVGESYFFREKKSFEILEEHILPQLIRSRRGTGQYLRIWSAGCATGEEPYSIAMLLSKFLPAVQNWNITIVATDINSRSLAKASAGVYSDWSFRDTSPWIRQKYFKRTEDGHFEILPHIKRMVVFSYLNLAEDAYPWLCYHTDAMDVIFCRNVLMYFTSEQARNVVAKCHRSLVDGGWLIVSASETSPFSYSQFVTVNFPGAIYQKDRERTRKIPLFPNRLDEEPKVSFSPSGELADESGSQFSLSQKFLEPLPSEVVEQKKTTSNPTPYLEALALYERGLYTEAEEKVTTLLSRNQDDLKAMALLARVYANQGKLADALEWSEKAIATDKLNAGCHYLHATILLEQGAWEGAGLSLQRTLYLDPHFVLAHFTLGNISLRHGTGKQTAKHFRNALSLLEAYKPEDVLPESEGITALRLAEIIRSMRYSETFV